MDEKDIGMTVAIGLMQLKKTFKEMADLHRVEIANHENIRLEALRKAREVEKEDPVYAEILRHEAKRNLRHRESHEEMVKIYEGNGAEKERKLKGVIMAAGNINKWFWKEYPTEKMVDYKPKCLLKYKGEPVLEQTIKLLKKHSIEEIIIVVGYLDSQIREFVTQKGFKVKFLYNPDSTKHGALHSLLLGLNEIDGDETFLLVMGDVVLLSEQILIDVLKCEDDICYVGGESELQEFYLGKIKKNALGSINDIVLTIGNLTPFERGKFLGFSHHLRKKNAVFISCKDEDGKQRLIDIDYWAQVREWEIEELEKRMGVGKK